MKNHILSIGVLAALTVSCSVREMDRADCRIDETFVARMETPAEADTKVFVDDNLRVLWDANDRVSIFNKYTYNQEYRFDGETGDNSVPSRRFRMTISSRAIPWILFIRCTPTRNRPRSTTTVSLPLRSRRNSLPARIRSALEPIPWYPVLRITNCCSKTCAVI